MLTTIVVAIQLFVILWLGLKVIDYWKRWRHAVLWAEHLQITLEALRKEFAAERYKVMKLEKELESGNNRSES